MQVVPDTGSSDLWLTTTGCLDCSRSTPLFNATISSSFQQETQHIPLSYGSRSAGGTGGPFYGQSTGFWCVIPSISLPLMLCGNGIVPKRSLVTCANTVASTMNAKKYCGRVAGDHRYCLLTMSASRHAVPFAIFCASNRHLFSLHRWC